MSGSGKRSFTSFVKPTGGPANPPSSAPNHAVPPQPGGPLPLADLQAPTDGNTSIYDSRPTIHGTNDETGQGRDSTERTRVVTPTGRVRTYSASRNLPGVTLRLSEQRWERLKMLSIQQRRPIQEILGEALADYMRSRGLPW
jgi:hypothetical protein